MDVIQRILRGLALPVGLPVALWIVASLIFASPAPERTAADGEHVAAAGDADEDGADSAGSAAAGDGATPKATDAAADHAATDAGSGARDAAADGGEHVAAASTDDAPAAEAERDGAGDDFEPAQPRPPRADRSQPRMEAARAEARPRTPRALRREARRALWDARESEAVALYREALAAAPGDPSIWSELGDAHYRSGDWRDAAHAYRTAALLLVDAGRPAEAAELVPVLMRIDPPSGEMVAFRLWIGEGR